MKNINKFVAIEDVEGYESIGEADRQSIKKRISYLVLKIKAIPS